MRKTLIPTTNRAARESNPYSTAGLQQNALTIRPRIHISNQNIEKYTDKQANFVITSKKIMNELEELDYHCISIAQVR